MIDMTSWSVPSEHVPGQYTAAVGTGGAFRAVFSFSAENVDIMIKPSAAASAHADDERRSADGTLQGRDAARRGVGVERVDRVDSMLVNRCDLVNVSEGGYSFTCLMYMETHRIVKQIQIRMHIKCAFANYSF